MKIIGVIPARYQSSRFPGKPLADICGKPMIWWVYQQVMKVPKISEVYIATDDSRISEICKLYCMNCVMTSSEHPDHISRVHEISDALYADYYMCINGDEPLIDPISIGMVIPIQKYSSFYFGGAMRVLTDPAETIDFANLKIIVNEQNKCIYISRSPIPYPRGSLSVKYNKYVGIECFNKVALDFFVNTRMGIVEKIEDIDHLRYVENGMPLQFTSIDSESLSVDTPKDLEKVRLIIQEKINKGELTNE